MIPTGTGWCSKCCLWNSYESEDDSYEIDHLVLDHRAGQVKVI